jgi:hypothetical protein
MNQADPKNGYKSRHIPELYAEDEDYDPKFYPFYPNNCEAGSSHLPEKGSFPVAPEAIQTNPDHSNEKDNTLPDLRSGRTCQGPQTAPFSDYNSHSQV